MYVCIYVVCMYVSGCFRVFTGSYMGVSRKLKRVSRKFQEYFKGASSKNEGAFKEFEGDFKGV